MVRHRGSKCHRQRYPHAAAHCDTCGKTWDGSANRGVNENSRNQHVCSTTHREPEYSCPVCGDTRFRTGACAAAHSDN